MKDVLSVIRFRLTSLWNSEYPLVVNRIISIVEAHNPEQLNLLRRFEHLESFKPKLAKIETQDRFDWESMQLSELDQKRNTLFSVIHAVAKAHTRTPIPEIKQQAQLVMSLLKKHGCNITSANYTAETKRLYDLLVDAESQKELKEAIEALALHPLFQELYLVNTEFDRIFMERSQRIAETERVDIRAIRLECDKVILELFDGIDYCVIEYKDIDYRPMLNALNALNSYYKQQLAARTTRRKQKKDVSTEEPITPEGTEQ